MQDDNDAGKQNEAAKRREIQKPIGGDSPNEELQSPVTPQNMGETSISGHQPSPTTDDDLLQEAQDEVDMYTEYSDNNEGEVSIADQITQAEKERS